MNCSPFDLRDYLLEELTTDQRRAVDAHLHTCPACQQELGRYQFTEAALLQIPQEELPRRIAFVSDAVLTPKPWEARFWSGLFQSGPRLAFASSGLLSAALVFHAFYARPVSSLTPPSPQASVTLPAASVPSAGIGSAQAVSVSNPTNSEASMTASGHEAALRAMVSAEVAKALASRDELHRREMTQLVAAVEQRYAKQREMDLATMEASFDLYRRKQNRTLAMLASYDEAKPVSGGVQ